MSSTLKKISHTVVNSPYLSRWVVLLIDVFVVTFATLSVYLVLGFFIRSTAGVLTYALVALTGFFVSTGVFVLYGTYRGIMRHTTMQEIWRIFLAVISKSIIVFLLFIVFYKFYGFTLSIVSLAVAQICDIVCSLALLVALRVFLIYFYELFMSSMHKTSNRILIYGDDTMSISLANYLSKNMHAEYRIMGFIKMQNNRSMLKLQGLTVFTIDAYEYFESLVNKKEITAIVFPSQASALAEKDRLIDYCINQHIKVLILPQLNEVTENGGITSQIREIKIEDLLGRAEIKINLAEIKEILLGKIVMVTGGAGSIGSELCRLISDFNIKKLVILDNAETPLHNIQLELTDKEHKTFFANNKSFLYPDGKETEEGKKQFALFMQTKYNFVIADVRAKNRMDRVFDVYKPQVIFHAAAYKHVPMMESNPCEAVNVNVGGTKIIADAAVKYGVEKVIMISTDKAVNPTNVMGCSKRLAEIYVQTLSRAIISGEVQGKTKFITTRFGNVLGSNGSVIPRFREQIMSGGPVTVTHKDIIRFFMTIPEACRLVLEAATMGEGYEIFVFDMGQPVKIADLAKNMISLAGFTPGTDIKIEYTGLRPGEKLYEELLNDKESTIPTAHKKISVAKVREYEYATVLEQFETLKSFAKIMDKTETVRCMKGIVPEFKSQNSIYSQLDHK
ncbi:MAG: nucleoside-diphosphate sugar epimerase/dehydratase [Bacteroidales bacterium]